MPSSIATTKENQGREAGEAGPLNFRLVVIHVGAYGRRRQGGWKRQLLARGKAQAACGL
jgi:hypothetical protein